MENYKVGEVIAHNDRPGRPMTVLDTKPCGTHQVRPQPHLRYQVLDADGHPDWLRLRRARRGRCP